MYFGTETHPKQVLLTSVRVDSFVPITIPLPDWAKSHCEGMKTSSMIKSPQVCGIKPGLSADRRHTQVPAPSISSSKPTNRSRKPYV